MTQTKIVNNFMASKKSLSEKKLHIYREFTSNSIESHVHRMLEILLWNVRRNQNVNKNCAQCPFMWVNRISWVWIYRWIWYIWLWIVPRLWYRSFNFWFGSLLFAIGIVWLCEPQQGFTRNSKQWAKMSFRTKGSKNNDEFTRWKKNLKKVR